MNTHRFRVLKYLLTKICRNGTFENMRKTQSNIFPDLNILTYFKLNFVMHSMLYIDHIFFTKVRTMASTRINEHMEACRKQRVIDKKAYYEKYVGVSESCLQSRLNKVQAI